MSKNSRVKYKWLKQIYAEIEELKTRIAVIEYQITIIKETIGIYIAEKNESRNKKTFDR